MSEQELKDFVDSLKEQGLNDEQILDIFFETFKSGELPIESLKSAAESMGYRLKGDFEKEASQGGGEEKDLSKDQIEAAKEIKEGESEEDYKERVAEGETAEESKESEDDEDSERKEAFKYLD